MIAGIVVVAILGALLCGVLYRNVSDYTELDE